jgi:predicted nucleic acid-binding OB-fold protein
LLTGVGPKKAEEMVDARRSSGGFATFEALDEACGLDGAAALAHRFAEEILDRNLQPRLVEMLLPVKA